MNRRTFLSSAAALAVSTTAFADILRRPIFGLPAGNPYIDNIGLQLWTVRNELEMDQEATLKAIKEAGYKQVELMNVMESDNIVNIAQDLDLGINSAHFNWETVFNPSDSTPSIESIIEKASAIGLEYLVIGYIGAGHRESADQFKAHADLASVAGEKCNAADIQLCYHNHAFEFKPLEDDVTGFELFMERFHRDFVMFELDVFWAQLGGWDAVETLNKLSGRVAQVHLKDLKKGSGKQFDESKVAEETFQPLGRGSIDMGKVIAACEKIGVKHCHVEQDYSPDPIESLGVSMTYLNGLEVKKEAPKQPDAAVNPPIIKKAGPEVAPFGGRFGGRR